MLDLPQPVLDDLFNVDNDNIDMALLYIEEELESFGLGIKDHQITGLIITIPFQYNKGLRGQMLINRLERLFSVEANTGDAGLFLPINGSWCDVRRYLTNTMAATNLDTDDG